MFDESLQHGSGEAVMSPVVGLPDPTGLPEGESRMVNVQRPRSRPYASWLVSDDDMALVTKIRPEDVPDWLVSAVGDAGRARCTAVVVGGKWHLVAIE